MGAWHSRKQVMFNLIIQATHCPVDDLATANIARCQHLTGEEIDFGIMGNQRQTLVVGSKAATHIYTEHEELHAHAGRTKTRTQHNQNEQRAADETERQQCKCDAATLQLSVL